MPEADRKSEDPPRATDHPGDGPQKLQRQARRSLQQRPLVAGEAGKQSARTPQLAQEPCSTPMRNGMGGLGSDEPDGILIVGSAGIATTDCAGKFSRVRIRHSGSEERAPGRPTAMTFQPARWNASPCRLTRGSSAIADNARIQIVGRPCGAADMICRALRYSRRRIFLSLTLKRETRSPSRRYGSRRIRAKPRTRASGLTSGGIEMSRHDLDPVAKSSAVRADPARRGAGRQCGSENRKCRCGTRR